ncbi:MAG TPA: M1 family aminopeptidase [Flavobacteriales bacterium]|nr:M1 family aminopeptidase [Flavobacteriales bacterium]
MTRKFFLFEVRYWLRQPMVYIFILITGLLPFFAVISDNVQIGGGIGNVYRNANNMVFQFYGAMSFLGILMVAAFVNATAIRDFTSNTAQIIFSTPVGKRSYLLGKFLGSTFISMLPMLGVSLGIVLGSWWPTLDPLRVGPNSILAHAEGFLVLALPNIIFSAAIIFAVAVLLRSTMASFITAIVLIVGYAIAGALMSDMENQTIAAMLDPFGGTATELVSKYWSVDEKNSALLPLNGVLLWNRLAWTGVAVLVFLFGYVRFSFTDRVQRAKAVAEDTEVEARAASAALPAVHLQYGRRAGLAQFITLLRSDFLGILKGTSFIIIIMLGLAQLFTSLAFVTSMYGNTTYPVTYNVADMMSGALGIYLLIIVVFYAGQLVWKERDPKFDGIVNALPMSTATNLLSKVVALMGIVLVVHLFAMLAGMATQLFNGYTRFQPGVYLGYFVLPGTVTYACWAILAVLVHVLVNNKYLGWFVFIVLFLLNTFAWPAVDVVSNLARFNSTSGLVYSDMNGFGPYLKGWLFFKGYWVLFAGLLAYLGYLYAVRGNDTAWRWRSHNAALRLHGAWPMGMVLLVGWLGMLAYGLYSTKVVNTYRSIDETEELQVRYEKEYKKYQGMPQPHYTDVSYLIDLDPAERSIRYTVDIVLKNKHDVAVDTLYFDVPHRMKVEVEIPGAELVLNDTALDQRMYRLARPMAPGDELSMKVSGGWRPQGISNSVEFTSVVDNGSFFNNMDLIPSIGYAPNGELTDREKRRKHGLPPNERMPRLSADPAKRMDNYLMPNSDWVNVRTTIGTAPDQIAVAPGSLRKEWEADGKRWFTYELDYKALNFYSFLSARYEVARETWKDPNGVAPDVELEVYYQKEHGVNVPRMLNSLHKSLDYYTAHFGPYRQKQARIIEFPRYASFAQAFPGTMPYSEGIGFITDLTAKEDIDMVFYVVAHEVGHQWWAHQVMGANMQGSTLLSESMAQYSALMVMEKEYGPGHMRKFLKYEGDKYQNARGFERLGEQPLLTVENQGYIHYNKASTVLYGLRNFLGEDTLNHAFRSLVDSFGYADPPWPTSLDWYAAVRKVTPDSLTYLLEDGIKYITLYDNKVIDAKGRMNADSTWTVTVKLTAEKEHADSLGKGTPVLMDDWMDIAVERWPSYGKDKELNDVPLVKERVKLHTGENMFTFTVAGKPNAVVIDPDQLFFDRHPEDRRKRVELEGKP